MEFVTLVFFPFLLFVWFRRKGSCVTAGALVQIRADKWEGEVGEWGLRTKGGTLRGSGSKRLEHEVQPRERATE